MHLRRAGAILSSGRPLLSLGQSFELDANIAVRRAVLLGQPDAGKTNGLTVIAEGLLKLNVPPVLLDWKGDLWGLRSSARGDREGFAVAIFGGDHGDIDIEENDGRELGHVVAEEHLAAIVDLSAFATDAARRRFAAAFLRGFFSAKKNNVTPHPLLIDEYQKFAPEKPYEGERELLSVTEQVIGLGRKRGIGVIGTALRAAGLNKNIVEVSDVYFFMQMAGKNDLAAIGDTIKRVASAEERTALLTQIPQLHRGEVFVYSPAWLRILERHRFRLRETFDSSKTPEVGVDANAIEPRILAMPDIPALSERVAATREKRESEDPEALRRRIQDLEVQLKRPAARAVDVDEPETVRLRTELSALRALPPREVSVLTDDDRKLLERVAARVDEDAAAVDLNASSLLALLASTTTLTTSLTDVREVLKRIADGPAKAATTSTKPRVEAATNASVTKHVAVRAPRSERPLASHRSALGPPGSLLDLTTAPRAILAALGSLPDGHGTRKAIAALAGYSSRKSTIRNALSALRIRGLIESTGESLVLTPAGRSMAGPPKAPKTSAEMIAMWREKIRYAGPVALFDALIAAYPEPLTRDALGERAGVDPAKSTMRNALSRLRVQGLIVESDAGVVASDTLFPKRPRGTPSIVH